MLKQEPKNQYTANGVSICPVNPVSGDKVTLVYDGILLKKGATELFAHVGYGQNWTHSKDFRMVRTSDGFETSLPLQNHDQINVAFKDCAENWDNNNGSNYTFQPVER